MQKRPYGRTQIDLSIIGFGAILVTDTEASEASRLVARAVDYGVNYFDVAPSYGNAEECAEKPMWRINPLSRASIRKGNAPSDAVAASKSSCVVMACS